MPRSARASAAAAGALAQRGRGERRRPVVLGELTQAPCGALAHEHVDIALVPREQTRDEVSPDEARRAGDEVGHRLASGAVVASDRGHRSAAAALPGREPRGAAERLGEDFGARGGLERESLLEGTADAREHRAAVGDERLLGEAGELARERERALQWRAIGHHLADEPHRERLARADHAPGEDQIEGAAETDDPREALRAAIEEGHAEAALGEAERRALGGNSQIAPERQLEAACEAEAGDRGDRGLARRQPREPERSLAALQPVAERLERLEVGARAEGVLALAGDDERARVVFGLEAREGLVQRRRGRPVDRVSPLRAGDREKRRGVTALVADRGESLTSRRACARLRAPRARPCVLPCAARAGLGACS